MMVAEITRAITGVDMGIIILAAIITLALTVTGEMIDRARQDQINRDL